MPSLCSARTRNGLGRGLADGELSLHAFLLVIPELAAVITAKITTEQNRSCVRQNSDAFCHQNHTRGQKVSAGPAWVGGRPPPEAAGVESARRSGTPLPDRTGSVIARLNPCLLSAPPAASRSHCSPGDGAGPSAPRLPPGRDGAHPRVRGGSPGRGPGRGGERGAARAGASAFPPSSLPLSPAPAAPALRTTAAASRHVGRQAPGR